MGHYAFLPVAGPAPVPYTSMVHGTHVGLKSSFGIALKLGATLAFSLMYATIKLAGPVPVGEVVFFRCLFALLPLFALSFFTVGPLSVVRTSRPLFHVVRSIAGTLSMFLNFAALTL